MMGCRPRSNERRKYGLTILLGISLLLILSQCSKHNEPAPFFDGLFLEYIRKAGSSNREITFEVEALNDSKFQITLTRTPQLIGEKIDTMQVNRFGRVDQSTFRIYEEKFSPIWIPVSKMKIGDKFDGRKKVVDKERWKDWNVLVVKDTPTGALDYFDIRTGFHVGSYVKTSMGLVEEILVDTNADIPTLSGE